MGNRKALLLILLVFSSLLVASVGAYEYERRGKEVEEEGESSESEWFLLHDSKEIVRTDAGVMRVVRGGFGGGVSMFQSPMYIGFITMEPNTLFIPQYLDSHLTLFVRRGKVCFFSLCF